MINKLVGGLLILPILIFSSCDKKAERPLTALESKGKAVYLSNCIACHNPDPRIAGSIGPDIAFSSLELVEARVVKAEYPPGYTPKRQSKMMPAFPQLAADVPALHAYLNSFTK
jgi:mono/diheme cytochrome c family protein